MARRRRPTKNVKPKGWAGLVAGGLFVSFLLGRGCSSPQTTSLQRTESSNDLTQTPPSEPAGGSRVDASPEKAEATEQEEQKEKQRGRVRRLFAADGTEITDPAKWRPAILKLTAPVEMTWIDKGDYKGKRMFKAGDTVKLLSIVKDSVYVDVGGSTNKIPASSTDLSEQMAAVYAKESE